MVTVTNGTNRLSQDNFVGMTVEEVVDTLTSLWNLSGDESYAVKRSGDSDYDGVDYDYVLQNGDTLRISRSAGGKGSR